MPTPPKLPEEVIEKAIKRGYVPKRMGMGTDEDKRRYLLSHGLKADDLTDRDFWKAVVAEIIEQNSVRTTNKNWMINNRAALETEFVNLLSLALQAHDEELRGKIELRWPGKIIYKSLNLGIQSDMKNELLALFTPPTPPKV